ncbi:MAG: GDSL-type esterase/lipase family protein [Phycisphaerales bacterium JB063]
MWKQWIAGVLLVLAGCQGVAQPTAPTQAQAPERVEIETDHWRGDIDRFLEADRAAYPPRGGVLFYGSSTIRLWDVDRFFAGRPVTNRGFGGSTLPAVLRYMHLIALPYEPAVIVFYCGTNDIALGQPAQFVVEDFVRFTERVHEALPNTHIVLLGIAPSVSRWGMWEEMTRANTAMSAYCDEADWLSYVDQSPLLIDEQGEPIPSMFTDGLHMSEAGYTLVSELVEQELARLEEAHPSIRRADAADAE